MALYLPWSVLVRFYSFTEMTEICRDTCFSRMELHPCIQRYVHGRTRIYVNMRIQGLTRTRTQTIRNTHRRYVGRKHTYDIHIPPTHTHTYIEKHTHTYTYTNIKKHTHAHTHVQEPSSSSPKRRRPKVIIAPG